jgi:hypothetical protein
VGRAATGATRRGELARALAHYTHASVLVIDDWRSHRRATMTGTTASLLGLENANRTGSVSFAKAGLKSTPAAGLEAAPGHFTLGVPLQLHDDGHPLAFIRASRPAAT